MDYLQKKLTGSRPWAYSWGIALGLLCMSANVQAENRLGTNSTTAVAQSEKTVTGHVEDENGEPLIGVTVAIVDGVGGTITDFDGNFTIKLPQGKNKLSLSYTGYKTKVVTVTGANLDVKLDPDALGLDEVVVVGYGTQKKRDLTGAIATIKSDDIVATPLPNPVEALQGKVAGLDITRSSGAAGESSTIKLRGTRSLTASEGNNDAPLVLVDGLPGSLETINANDIESIEVLKDASSTAVYGSAGANGVIIVTTKSGSAGKTSVNLNAYIGINGWSTVPKMHHGADFFNLRKQALQNGKAYTDDAHVFTPEVYNAYVAGHDVDWADELLRTGVTQNYSLSVSGGTEKTKAYMSLNFSGEDGQYANDNYKVYSSNIKVDHQLGKWVTIGTNFQGSYTHQNRAYAKLENALIANPIGSAYDGAGNVKVFPVDGDESYVNLLVNNKSNYRNNRQRTNIHLNPYIRINPIKGLTFESRLGLSLAYYKTNQFDGIGSYQYYDKDKTADGVSTSNNVTASVENYNIANYKWENILTYNFNIKQNHQFTVTAVTSWNHNRQEYTYASADHITSNKYLWHNLGAAENHTVDSRYTMSKGIGLVGRINYSFLGRYLASVSVRHDGSSVLAEDNRWDTFPAFSLGWRISDEKFMEKTRNWLDNLKIRFGWGVTGTSSISPYKTQMDLVQDHFILGNQTLTSYHYKDQIVDPNLGWEKSYNTNIGFDAAFLNGRIELNFDYYYTKTKDIIWTKKVPVTSGGFSTNAQYETTTNICESQNNGMELTVTGRPFIGKREGDFNWTVNATFTLQKEKLTKFSGDNGSTQYINGDIILREGEPINSFYGYKLNGTWKTSEAADAACFNAQPGDLKIDCPGLTRNVDANGNVFYTAVNAAGETVTYDAANPYDATQVQQVLGHPEPDWTLGLKNSFSYKNFDLSVFLYWRFGQMIKYGMLGRFDPQGNKNFPTYFDYWTPETGDADHIYPAMTSIKPLSEYDGYYGLQYVDGSFFKIKNITLGYTLPKSLLKRVGIESLRVYGTITNPLVVAKSDRLKDYDPEMAGSLDYPLTKQMVFGVNVSF